MVDGMVDWQATSLAEWVRRGCTVYCVHSGQRGRGIFGFGVWSPEYRFSLLSLNFQSKIAKITSKDYIVGYIGK